MSNAATMPERGTVAETAAEPPRLPAYGRVFRTLVYFLIRGNSGGLLLVLALLGLGWIGLAAWLRHAFGDVGYGGIAGLTWVLGLLIAYQTWDGETPAKRTYYRSQPVPEPVHDLLRVGAGVVFLGVAVAMLITAEVVALSILLPGWAGEVPAANWLRIPGVALATYAMGSVASVASERPGRWMVGVPAALLGLAVIASELHEDPSELWFMAIWTGTVGLGPLMGEGMLTEPRSTWVPAVAFWFAVGAVGVVGATFQRRGAR